MNVTYLQMEPEPNSIYKKWKEDKLCSLKNLQRAISNSNIYNASNQICFLSLFFACGLVGAKPLSKPMLDNW